MEEATGFLERLFAPYRGEGRVEIRCLTAALETVERSVPRRWFPLTGGGLCDAARWAVRQAPVPNGANDYFLTHRLLLVINEVHSGDGAANPRQARKLGRWRSYRVIAEKVQYFQDTRRVTLGKVFNLPVSAGSDKADSAHGRVSCCRAA